MKHYNIPIFVPHLGCPHDCVFCNQKKITGAKSDFKIDDAQKTIDDFLKTIEDKNKDRFVEIAFFGGSFTAIDKETFEILCLLAKKYIEDGKVNGIRCSTRPDAIDDEKLKFMKGCGFTTIELGVQSTDELVLLKSGRGHTKKDVFDACEKIKKHGIGLGLQMMTGLPHDTDEKSVQTAKDIISLKPDCVRVYPTLTIEGTRLFDMHKEGTYKPQNLDDALILCAKILEMFYDANINVVRVGLQTTDNINESTVIGPYHPAFREKCESMIYRNKLEKDNLKNGDTVYVNSKEISKIVGEKRANIKYFKKKYGIDIYVKADDNIKRGEYKIER